MKRKLLIATLSITLVIIMLGGCYGNSVIWADNSTAKVGGITVSAEKKVTKKAFIEGVDSEARIQKYGELGSLDKLTVKVNGSVEKQKAVEKLTPITVEGNSSHVTAENESVSYYTDYIKIKIQLPEGATKLDTLDGDGAITIDTTQSVEDGYYYTNIPWLKVDSAKENFAIFGDSESKDEYYYFAFKNDDNVLLKDYLVHIIYEVEFK